MLVTIFAAAAFAAAQAPAAIFPPREPPAAARDTAADCPSMAPRLADEDWASRSRPRRLIELPPGRLELAVHREVDGCPIPAVLREGLGGSLEPTGRPGR
jgi:hypothetical protein